MGGGRRGRGRVVCRVSCVCVSFVVCGASGVGWVWGGGCSDTAKENDHSRPRPSHLSLSKVRVFFTATRAGVSGWGRTQRGYVKVWVHLRALDWVHGCEAHLRADGYVLDRHARHGVSWSVAVA